MRDLNGIDEWVAAMSRGLATLSGAVAATRARPGSETTAESLTPEETKEAAALMRVNHVGEVCAQALYEAQALGSDDPQLKRAFLAAATEEVDHLAWTQQRIDELGGRPSLLNPLWYLGAFGIGLLAARIGDRASLGFMAETERQVEEHLNGHLQRLPAGDGASRAIVKQMRDDEAHHAHTAMEMGGAETPWPLRVAMKLAARVMTTTAHRI